MNHTPEVPAAAAVPAAPAAPSTKVAKATKATKARKAPARKAAVKTTPRAAPSSAVPKDWPTTGAPVGQPAKPASKKAPKNAPEKASQNATVAKAGKPRKATVPAATRPEKAEKVKLVRDSFTIPAPEYDLLAVLKQRALKQAHPAKKSELLRAGIKLLATLGDAALLQALQAVPAIKTGRPKARKGE